MRSLYKARGFAMAVILTLALGIGANTAMFTLLRGTLLRALPNRDGERLVYLRQSAMGANEPNTHFSVPEIIDYRTASKTLGAIAEYSPMTFTLVWTGDVLKFIPVSGDWRTVIGVVGDTRDAGLDTDPTPSMYQPFTQEVVFGAALIAKTKSDPALLGPAAVRAIRELYPRQRIENVASLDQVRDATVAPRRLNAFFIASFGVLAMLIAMVGIAGVLAFSVSSRTNEIGIRMSLGADASRVHRMILGEGGTLLAVGLAAGAIGALLATRLLQGLLFGVAPHDPMTLGTVALMLGGVGVVACWLPAVRAARVDPAVALRAE